MYHIELLQKAAEDMDEAYNFYKARNEETAQKFYREISHYFHILQETPYVFAVKFSGKYRFATMKVFPYLIVYRIDEDEKKVFINSIFHTSRNPKEF
jgi:plasmid stabilization system protein ParE